MSTICEPSSCSPCSSDNILVERMVSINISPKPIIPTRNEDEPRSSIPSRLSSPCATAPNETVAPTPSRLATPSAKAPVALRTLASLADTLRSRPSTPLASQPPSRVSSPGIMTALMMSTNSMDSRDGRDGEATTFFDDIVNSPRPPPSNIVELSPTTHLMDVYQRFFDGHPELLCPHGHSHHVTIGHDDDSFEDQVLYSSEEISDIELDMEMEMVLDSPPLLIRRARAMADQRQMVPR